MYGKFTLSALNVSQESQLLTLFTRILVEYSLHVKVWHAAQQRYTMCLPDLARLPFPTWAGRACMRLPACGDHHLTDTDDLHLTSGSCDRSPHPHLIAMPLVIIGGHIRSV